MSGNTRSILYQNWKRNVSMNSIQNCTKSSSLTFCILCSVPSPLFVVPSLRLLKLQAVYPQLVPCQNCPRQLWPAGLSFPSRRKVGWLIKVFLSSFLSKYFATWHNNFKHQSKGCRKAQDVFLASYLSSLPKINYLRSYSG